VMVAKPGLDGHDRGAKVLALALKDAGMEVIYLGLRQTPESIARSAVDENVDVVCLSCLSGAHNHLFPEVVRSLREMGASDIPVLGGGLIPEEDHDFLRGEGIAEIFPPTVPMQEVVRRIGELARG